MIRLQNSFCRILQTTLDCKKRFTFAWKILFLSIFPSNNKMKVIFRCERLLYLRRNDSGSKCIKFQDEMRLRLTSFDCLAKILKIIETFSFNNVTSKLKKDATTLKTENARKISFAKFIITAQNCTPTNSPDVAKNSWCKNVEGY